MWLSFLGVLLIKGTEDLILNLAVSTVNFFEVQPKKTEVPFIILSLFRFIFGDFDER